MERKQKHARSRSCTGGVLASFLRSTAATFSSSLPSHGKSSFNHRNAFSGPIVSIVPPEARGGMRSKAGSRASGSGYRTPEPSSPKVSCIGQIKKTKSKKPNKVNPCGKNGGACPLPPRRPECGGGRRPLKSSLVKRMSFFRRSRPRDGGFKVRGSTAVAAAPAGLGQMKRFTSGRAAFQDFDWREAETRRACDDEDEYEEDEGFVAYSAPLVLGGGVVASEPRKEVNLWQRRPMAPPSQLQLP